MIITKIQGGIGNQLFQYAIGRNLALKNNTELKFDSSFFNNTDIDTPRIFLLDKFNISGETISDNELRKIKLSNFQNRNTLKRIVNKFLKIIEETKPIQERKFVSFRDIIFHPEVLQIRTKKNIYLAGNWPTDKYFSEIENVIRKDFTLKSEFSQEAKKISDKIINSNSISIHIRRGDYENIEKTKSLHGGICTLDYYIQAIELIKINNPEFFIFSDDIAWVKDNFKINHPITYVSGNNIPDYEELILMSQCKHNIIANSTFSWWGAWLNHNSNKTVIAPKKWFNSDTDISDLIPEGWTKI